MSKSIKRSSNIPVNVPVGLAATAAAGNSVETDRLYASHQIDDAVRSWINVSYDMCRFNHHGDASSAAVVEKTKSIGSSGGEF